MGVDLNLLVELGNAAVIVFKAIEDVLTVFNS